MVGPILYIAEVDYLAEHSAPHGKWNDWYAHRHAPDLFKLGARSVSSYRSAVGGLAVLNVYEIPDAAVFSTPAYKGMTPKDPYATETRELSAGKKRAQTLYLERAVLPADGQTIDADWISVLRFDLPESADVALLDWLQGDARKILVAHGVKHLRYGTRIAENVGAGSFRPRCVIFAEWAVRPLETANLLPALARRFDAAVTGAENFIGWRAYPWPDAKRA
jgi:hypothetical protein